MNQKSILTIAVLFAIAILFSCNSKHGEEANAFPAEAIPVETAPIIATGRASTITATGQVTTENEARYAFKIGGIIDRIYVKEGQFFKKGQLLASLKTTEIDAQLSQSALAYEKTKRDYTRTNNLYQDSVATLEQLQNVKTNVDIAGKAVAAIAFNKRFAFIYAEADGFIKEKIANPGEVVAAGTPIFAINETSGDNNWTLKLGVTDKEWAAILIGQPAEVSIDAFPGKKFTAAVSRKSQAADAGSGSFQVELNLDINDSRPAVGMYAKATIHSAAQEPLATIPYDAMIEADGNNAFVFVPEGNNKVKRIPIVIESFTNELVQVKSGLENIKEVIVSNSAFLNDRSTIHISK